MVDFPNSNVDRLRNAKQCLRQIGPTTDGDDTLKDSDILNMTTVHDTSVAAVTDLYYFINNAPKKDSESALKHREALEAVEEMNAYGVFTNTNLAAANTFDGLILILTNKIAAINPAEDEIETHYYGATNYQGNVPDSIL